jgi:Leucine-rich repeat (LRR) protein
MSMPALPSLRVLELRGMGLQHLPIEVATALGQLTHLDLATNDFERIPGAVVRIPTLRKLDLSRNPRLELEATDVDLLAALPHLVRLGIYKHQEGEDDEESNLSQGSVRVLFALGARLPGLQLHGFELQGDLGVLQTSHVGAKARCEQVCK